MATILQMRQRVQTLASKEVLVDMLFVEIKRYENIILNQQKAQLNEGEDYKGDSFGTYSQLTEDWQREYTPRKPKIAGHEYNFEDTGGLFDGMYLLFDDNKKEASFWSKDDKTPLLVKKYKTLFGLQPERLKELIERIIYPVIMLKTRKHLAI